MERERRGSRGYAQEPIHANARHADPVRVLTPEEQAAERVAKLKTNAHSAASDAKKLASITLRDEWRTEKTRLQTTEQEIRKSLEERKADAATSDQTRADYAAAETACAELTRTLGGAQEPRVKRAVAAELDLEPQLVSRTANADDVLAWAAGLSGSQASALADRVREATTARAAPEDRDTFAIELANYLAATRTLDQFRAVLADPKRFDAAAYRRAREARVARADAPASTNTPAVETANTSANANESPAPRQAAVADGAREPAALSDDAATTTTQDPDTVLRQVLDSPEMDVSAFAVLDGSTRRALARRLAKYRPGSGDELAARFVRLDRTAQNQILDALHGKTSATATPAPLAPLPTAPAAAPESGAAAQVDAPVPRMGMGDVHVAEAKQDARSGPMAPTPTPEEPELPALSMVSSESELLRLLQPVGPDPAAIAQRKHALAQLLAAVPERERAAASARMRNPLDAIGALVSRLDWATHVAAFEALAAGILPAPLPADAGSWSAFLATLGPEFGADRFHVPDVAIDGLWKQSATANLIAEPGLGPPLPSTGAELHVSVKNVTGEVTRRQVVWWPAGAPSLSGVPLQLDGVGRHEVVIDVVIDGLVRKRILRPALVRLAAKSTDVAKDVSAEEVRAAGASMSDADVTAQSVAIREQLRAHEKPGANLATDKEYQHLRAMLAELEWQATARAEKTAAGTPGTPLDTGKTEFSDVGYGDQGFEPKTDPSKPGYLDVDWRDRAALRPFVEDLIARRGFAGARTRVLASVYTDLGGEATDAMIAEIDAIEAEHAGDADLFAGDAQNIALAMLDRSEAEIRAELERYGIAKTGIRKEGREQWGAQGNELQAAELSKLAARAHELGAMKLTLDRYVNEVRGSADVYSDTDRGSPEKIEALALTYMVELQAALQEFPSLALFLPGNGKHPDRTTLDDMGSAAGGGANAGKAVAPGLGYEMEKKLQDIALSRAQLSKPNAVFGLPKIIAITKSHRHIVPGSLGDRVINEASAKHGAQDWTDYLLMGLQLALTVGLAFVNPAVGAAAAAGEASTAALVATAAANVGMIAWDVKGVLEMTGEMRALEAYNNTSIHQAGALLGDLPPGWLVLLSAIMTGVGVGSAGREMAQLGKAADVGRLATAKQSVTLGKSLREALLEAGGDATNPRVVELTNEIRALAYAVMDEGRADAFLRDVLPRLGARSTDGRALISSGKTLAEADVQRLAQQVGVEHITQVEKGLAVRVVYADRGGRLAVPELVARRDVDIQLVLDHAGTIDAVKRYNRTIDELRDAMGRATANADHEVAAEIAKHERILGERRMGLAEALERGDANAAGKLDDEILFYEGEARHWQEIATRGDHVERGYIEGLDTQTTREAIKANYPDNLPDGYFYRRWSNGGDPALPEYQVVRGSTAAKDGPSYHLQREGTGWQLVEGDRTGDKVAKVYTAGAQTEEVFTDLIQRSESLRQYGEVMAELEKKMTGIPAGHYRTRMEEIVGEQQRASGASLRANPGEVDEEMLRHAIKQELRSDVLMYLDSLGPEEAAREFQRLAPKLNSSDLGNLGEDWYRTRFALGGVKHPKASREALANMRPPIIIERDRFIDSLLPDGTAVEIKSIAGKLSKREEEQLKDTLTMLEHGAEIGHAGTMVTKVKYVFTRPEGLKANLNEMERLLKNAKLRDKFLCEVFLADGTTRTITSVTELNQVRALL